jgi:Fe2+ or Zn2+ uptake regulation protein
MRRREKETMPTPEITREQRRSRPRGTAERLTQAGALLEELDWRLLHWLLCYPLQRADDLVVGVARWASRATVYRHIQFIAERGLIESVVPKTPGAGKHLYHLSNLGLSVLANHLNTPARDLARSFQADETGLLPLLPHLPTLLLLQGIVNGLVLHAAGAMTTQGRRPTLVRWTWQRDLLHRFQYREKRMRLFVDGCVALCIRTQQGDGITLDRWYGLLLLSTELDDERVMRLRLERLLCWRESPERWSSYQHMLPVVILARSIRQREHWQRAVESTALSLRVEPLAGALATLPSAERAQVNPWRLNWHTLATEEFCYLQDLLKPLPPVAFPSSLALPTGENEDERSPHSFGTSAGLSPTTGPPTRLSRLIRGNLARRAAALPLDQPVGQELIALLGLRLTPGQWCVLSLLLDHPLLSDRDLVALLALQRKSVRNVLYHLHHLGCLAALPTQAGTRWYLSEYGLRLIAAANHFHLRNLAVISGDEAGAGTITLKQRGVDWLVAHLQHTAGIYRFFAALAEAARRVSGHQLCWWETGARCERRYQAGEAWYNLRPDALAEYRVGQHQFRFWLEWDRGTMNARDLAIKLASYAQYLASREWSNEHHTLPRLVCIAPDIAQERRVQRAAQAGLAQVPGIEVWTSTERLLNEQGPLAPIWSRSIPQQRGQDTILAGDSLRHCLFGLLAEKTNW